MILFFLPLMVIAFWEVTLDTNTNRFMKNWFSASDEGEEDDPQNQDPEVREPDGRMICKVPFKELVKNFPDATVVSHCLYFRARGDSSKSQSEETSILNEISSLSAQLQALTVKFEARMQ